MVTLLVMMMMVGKRGTLGISPYLHRRYIPLNCLVACRREYIVLMRRLRMRSNVLHQDLRLFLFLATVWVLLRLLVAFQRGELARVLLLVDYRLSKVDAGGIGCLAVAVCISWMIDGDPRRHHLIALLGRACVIPRAELFLTEGA